MKYIILPIEDAQIIFTEEELSTMRKSTDNTQVIVHENILVDKRNQLGLVTLPVDGVFEWTYPVYEYGSDELNNLLSSEQWTSVE